MKYVRSITTAFTVLLVAAATLTRAQDTPPGNTNTPPPTVCKFNDIVQASFNEISSQQNWFTTGFNNVFAYKPINYFSMGVGIGIEYKNPGMDVPMSADFRFYFKPGKYVAPFLNLYGGYAFAGGTGYDADNAFSGLNLGINILVAHNMSLQMALGVKMEGYNNRISESFGNFSSDNVTMPFTIGLAF